MPTENGNRTVQRVEVRPGVLVNMRPEDRRAFEKQRQAEQAGDRPDGLVTAQIETASVVPAETADLTKPKPRKR